MKKFSIISLFLLLSAAAFGQVAVQQAPGTYTDNSIVRRDGTYNKVQNSGVIVDDSDGLFVPGVISAGSGPTTLTDTSGKILSAALNIVAAAQGGFGANISASSGVPLFATGTATFTGTSGTGNFALVNSPAFTTPSLGVASATSINKVAITAPATSATLTIANGKTLTANNSITIAGTDGVTMTTPTTSFTAARTDAANTFTGVQSMTSPAITTSITTASTSFTAFAGATTLFTVGGTGATASSFFPSTLDTTSSTTGAIRTSGGISAAKALNIGTGITQGGNTFTFGSTARTMTTGAGTPEAAITASVGSLYLRNDGGSGTTLYSKTSGTGNTGWAAIGSSTITGSDTQVMFFDGANNPAGDAGMTYNKTTDSLTLVGTLTTGSGASTAGAVMLGQGTTQSTGTTNITIQAPTSVTSYIRTLPGTVGSTGYVKETVAGSVQTESVVTTIPATDIAAGALASTMTATTQTAGDTSTKLSTTAYADTAALATHLGTFASPNTAAGSITWTAPVYDIYTSASAALRTYTLPAASSYTGRAFILYVAVGTNHVNVQPASGAQLVLAGTLLTANHYAQAATSAPGNYICFRSDGTNWVSLGSSGTWADASSP